MKQKYFFTGLCLLLILIFISGCAPESETESASLFDKIVLDGANTRSADFEYGMSVEDVLKILNLKEEDLFSLDTYPLDEASSPVSGASEMTMMATEDAFFYSEFGESLPFRLMFTFYDNALRKVVYNVYIDVEDPGEGYELAMEFMNTFIEKTGAKPVENGTEFEYHTYGSAEKEGFLTPGGNYSCQFFHGGVLGEISISSFTPSPDLGYEQEVMVQLGICLMLDRIGQ